MDTVRQLTEHMDWMHRLAARLLGDDAAADDLVQETLIEAMRSRPDTSQPVRPWLAAVLRNRARMQFRANERRDRREAAITADPSPTPEELLAVGELQSRIAAAVQDLGEPLRATVLMRFHGGMTSAQIARHLGIPEGTVRRRLKDALDRLRAELDRQQTAETPPWRRTLVLIALPRWRASPAAPKGLAATLGLLAASLAWVVLPISPAPQTAAVPKVSKANDLPVRPPALSSAALATRELAPAAALTEPCPPPYRHVRVARTGQDRPRLVVDRGDLCRIKADIERPDSAQRHIFTQLRAAVDADAPAVFSSEHLNYARGHLAHAAALMYLLTGEARYVQQAMRQVRAMFDDAGHDALPDGTPSGLGRAATGLPLALVYDWTHAALDPLDRDYLASRLRRAIEGWRDYIPARSDWKASYRFGIYVATELLERLAVGGDWARPHAVDALADDLGEHLRRAYGAAGIGEDGLWRTALSGTYLLPAMLALRRAGHPAAASLLAMRPFWRVPLMTASPSTGSPRRFGPHLPLIGEQRDLGDLGWFSLLFAQAPPDAIPSLLRSYDESVGARSPLPPSRRYEPERSGRVWALLFHPGPDVKPAQEPPPRTLGDDEAGFYLFRTGARPGDVQAYLLGDFRFVPKRTPAPRTLQMGVRVSDSDFVGGGPGDQVSSLLIDGRPWASTPAPGKHVSFDGGAGGYAVVDASAQYAGLGVAAVTRHMAVTSWQTETPGGLVTTMDQIRSSRVHRYTWQVVSPDVAASARSAGDDAGRPSFLLRVGETYLKGWVVSPPDARIESLTPLRVVASGRDCDLWIVMAAGGGEPPVPTIEGQGLDSVVRFHGATVGYDRPSARMSFDSLRFPRTDLARAASPP